MVSLHIEVVSHPFGKHTIIIGFSDRVVSATWLSRKWTQLWDRADLNTTFATIRNQIYASDTSRNPLSVSFNVRSFTEGAKPLFVQTFTHPPITLLYHIWLKIVNTKASATLVTGQLYKVSLVFSSLPSSRIYESANFPGVGILHNWKVAVPVCESSVAFFPKTLKDVEEEKSSLVSPGYFHCTSVYSSGWKQFLNRSWSLQPHFPRHLR